MRSAGAGRLVITLGHLGSDIRRQVVQDRRHRADNKRAEYKAMRIRQVIAAIMILLSFSAQARTAFACGMMPGAALAACCCPDDGKDRCPPGASAGACCDLVAPADAPFAHATTDATAKHVQHASAESVTFGPAPHLLPASFDTGDRSGPVYFQAAASTPPLPLYLLTARLRL